jgi:hypothetical protein
MILRIPSSLSSSLGRALAMFLFSVHHHWARRLTPTHHQNKRFEMSLPDLSTSVTGTVSRGVSSKDSGADAP